MNETIGRIFSPIKPNMYDTSDNKFALSPDREIAQKLLTLANRKFTWQERLFGWKLDEQGQIGRLLNWHRLGIEAELEGQWRQADFFWNQVQIEIKDCAKKDALWQNLSRELTDQTGVVIMNKPLEMRQRLVEELLIDTHWAFYNGLSQQSDNSPLENRAFIHIEYIQELISLSNLDGKNLLSLLGLPWQKQINLCKKNGNWSKAIRVCQQRLKFFPQSLKFQNELVEVNTHKTLSKLSNSESSTKQLKDAKILKTGIRDLSYLLQKYPHNLTIFRAIGILYHLCGVKLSNSKHFAEALLDTEKALTYDPYFTQAHQTQTQLVQIMEQIQAHAREIKLQLSRQANTVLNTEGKQILKEAAKGFSLRDKYKNSSEAKNIAKAFQIAKDESQNSQDERVIIPVPPQNPTILTPRSSPNKLKTEPFLLWLFSHQDLNLKILPVLASLLLLVTGGLTMRERAVSSVRNDAYQQILKASQRQDYVSVVEAAEKFLTTKFFNGEDERESQVKQLYAQAIVQWNAQQSNPLDRNTLARIKRYQELINNSK
jgi:tetratricopeptide (TPR) repeat protein